MPRTTSYPTRVVAWALLPALALPLIQTGAAARAARHAPAPRWLVVNARTRTVTLTLIASYIMALGGYNFNGDGNGKMVLSVPAGYRVTVIFSNKGLIPHSAVFTSYAKRTSVSGFPLAFKGAQSPNPLTGMTAGKTQRFSFVATKVGAYALVCAVPGHAVTGMWDVLNVTSGGRPSLKV